MVTETAGGGPLRRASPDSAALLGALAGVDWPCDSIDAAEACPTGSAFDLDSLVGLKRSNFCFSSARLVAASLICRRASRARVSRSVRSFSLFASFAMLLNELCCRPERIPRLSLPAVSS